MIFRRMLQPRDVKKERLLQTEMLQPGRLGDLAHDRKKPSVIHAVMDDRDFFWGQFPKCFNVARRVPADGDDFALPLRQPSRDDAAVKHPLPVVFFCDVKRRQVVDGGRERARFSPGQAAVARHMQHIQPELAREPRQNHLMPEDVPERRTEFFRHHDQPGEFFCELEQRQIFFEHEQDELVGVGAGLKSADKREDVFRDAGLAALDDGSGQPDFHAVSSAISVIWDFRRG